MPVDPKDKLRKLSKKAPEVSRKVQEKIKRSAEIMRTAQDYKAQETGG
jgi:hypothetical protein